MHGREIVLINHSVVSKATGSDTVETGVRACVLPNATWLRFRSSDWIVDRLHRFLNWCCGPLGSSLARLKRLSSRNRLYGPVSGNNRRRYYCLLHRGQWLTLAIWIADWLGSLVIVTCALTIVLAVRTIEAMVLDKGSLSCGRRRWLQATLRMHPVFGKRLHAFRLVEGIGLALPLTVELGEALLETESVFLVVIKAYTYCDDHTQDEESNQDTDSYGRAATVIIVYRDFGNCYIAYCHFRHFNFHIFDCDHTLWVYSRLDLGRPVTFAPVKFITLDVFDIFQTHEFVPDGAKPSQFPTGFIRLARKAEESSIGLICIFAYQKDFLSGLSVDFAICRRFAVEIGSNEHEQDVCVCVTYTDCSNKLVLQDVCRLACHVLSFELCAFIDDAVLVQNYVLSQVACLIVTAVGHLAAHDIVSFEICTYFERSYDTIFLD